LYKLENLVSLFLSLLIFYTAFEILGTAIDGLGRPAGNPGVFSIAAAVFSLVVSFLLAKYKMKAGREENSPSMISEAKHTRLDALTTVGVLFAVVLSFMGFPMADPLIGIVIAVVVFKAGVGILVDSAKVLLDASLDYKTMKKIERLAAAQKGVRVKELVARNSGRYVFVDLVLETDIKDLKRVDLLRKQCEEKIRDEMPRIDKIAIELEYRKKDVLVYGVPLKENKKDSAIAPEFGTAAFFGLLSVSNKPGMAKVLESRVVKNEYAGAKEKRGIQAAEMLAKNRVDVLFTLSEMHKGGGYYALQDNFIEIRLTKAKTFMELKKRFVEEEK